MGRGLYHNSICAEAYIITACMGRSLYYNHIILQYNSIYIYIYIYIHKYICMGSTLHYNGIYGRGLHYNVESKVEIYTHVIWAASYNHDSGHIRRMTSHARYTNTWLVLVSISHKRGLPSSEGGQI